MNAQTAEETYLYLGSQVRLPVQIVTQSLALLAMRRSGKSNAAVVLAEEMYHAGLPFVVIDPKGDWWGMRSSADGKGPGCSIAIFGGDHGDVPLEPTAGHVIADLVADERLTCILDCSEFSKGARIRFLTAFADRLYRRNTEPLHVFLEEADDYIPQRVSADMAPCVGAFSTLVRRGGFKGIGITLISQRSAVLNKDVLTQTDNLCVLRTTSPQDRKAILEWVTHHALGKELVASLPELRDGEAWLWSPHRLGLMERFQFRRRRTFDSGATPEVGKSSRPPSTLADVDLAALKEAMADTIERAKDSDPAELRRRIAELERALSLAEQAKPSEPEIIMTVPAEMLDLLAQTRQVLADGAGQMTELAEQLQLAETAAMVSASIPQPGDTQGPESQSRPFHARGRSPSAAGTTSARGARRPVAEPSGNTSNTKLGKGERKVLAVLAQYPECGRSYNELAFLAGYSAKASTLGVILAKLRKAELVEPGNSPVRATAGGLAEAGGVVPMPTGPALLDHWMQHPRVGSGEKKVLRTLVEHYPTDLSHEEICAYADYSPAASTMGVILSKLRKLGLVEKGARRLAREFAEAIR